MTLAQFDQHIAALNVYAQHKLELHIQLRSELKAWLLQFYNFVARHPNNEGLTPEQVEAIASVNSLRNTLHDMGILDDATWQVVMTAAQDASFLSHLKFIEAALPQLRTYGIQLGFQQ